MNFRTLLFSSLMVFAACIKDNKPEDVIKPEVCPTDRWNVILNSSDLYFYPLNFLNKDTGYVSALTIAEAFQQYIFRTTDGGNSWIIDTVQGGISSIIYQIIPLCYDTLIGLGHSVYKSFDHGRTWNNIFPSQSSDPIFDICILDNSNWILADGTRIIRTADGGMTWQEVYAFFGMAVFDQLSFPSSTTGYAVAGMYSDYGGYGAIVKTTDGGNSWVLLNPEPWKSNHTDLKEIAKLQFLTEEVGYMFMHGSLYKTEDGGNNWSLINHNITAYTKDNAHFFNVDSGYVTDIIHIYFTKDGGRTWECDYAADSVSNMIIFLQFMQSGEGFAITHGNINQVLKKTFR